jgi:hypothetical protein
MEAEVRTSDEFGLKIEFGRVRVVRVKAHSGRFLSHG